MITKPSARRAGLGLVLVLFSSAFSFYALSGATECRLRCNFVQTLAGFFDGTVLPTMLAALTQRSAGGLSGRGTGALGVQLDAWEALGTLAVLLALAAATPAISCFASSARPPFRQPRWLSPLPSRWRSRSAPGRRSEGMVLPAPTRSLLQDG